MGGNSPPFCPFRDAAYGMSTYHLTLLDCLHAIDKAFKLGFFDFNDFDVEEYEYYEVRFFFTYCVFSYLMKNCEGVGLEVG